METCVKGKVFRRAKGARRYAQARRITDYKIMKTPWGFILL